MIEAVVILIGATVAVSSAMASARVVMGCTRFSSGQELLTGVKAAPRDCGNRALEGSIAGIVGARWRDWGAPRATGTGHLVDGLGFQYPAHFTVSGRARRDGITFYSRMHLVATGEFRGGAYRPGDRQDRPGDAVGPGHPGAQPVRASRRPDVANEATNTRAPRPVTMMPLAFADGAGTMVAPSPTHRVRGCSLLACCVTLLVALIVPARANAVIGGKVIRASRYSGVVQVVANDFAGGQGTLCGGALIAPRLVVTAGHCFLHVPLRRLQPVSVVFGRQWSYPHKNPPAGNHIRVSRVAHAPINPRLRQSYPDDVEVLHLQRRAPVTPLKLGSAYAAKASAAVFVLGWGLTGNHESELRRNQLHGLTMRVRSNTRCRQLAGTEYDAATQICLTARPGAGLQGTCYGDSGAPLLSANGSTVLGTVSTSNNFCGTGASIYTRLTSGPLRRWVEGQIKSSSRVSSASRAPLL